MLLHGLLAQAEVVGDVAVAVALGDELEYLPLPLGQILVGRSGRITSYNVCYTKLLRAMNQSRAPVRQVSHVISRGDTLSEIAERYNVSMSAIRSANRLSNDTVRVGQRLTIPIYAGS